MSMDCYYTQDGSSPLRRSVARSDSICSLPPRTATRRDSLFGTSPSSSDDEEDLIVMAFSTAHLYAPREPRRRFARRNAFCHFQLLNDAVQTSIDVKEGDASHHSFSRSPPPLPDYNGAESMDQCSSRRRKLALPQIREQEPQEEVSFTKSDSALAYGAALSEGRKLSRTNYRTSPSTDAIYSGDSTL